MSSELFHWLVEPVVLVAVAGGPIVQADVVEVEEVEREEVEGAIEVLLSPHSLPHSHASLRSYVCASLEDLKAENHW